MQSASAVPILGSMKTPRTLILSGALVASALGIGAAPALAAPSPVLTPDQIATFETQQAAHRACLEGQGVTLPERPTDPTAPRPALTDEQQAAMRAAREACADSRPDRPELTAEQQATLAAQVAEHRVCMQEHLAASGITRPEPGTRPADGTARPQRPQLTDTQKAAFDAARTACSDLEPNLGVDLPHGGRGGPGGPGGHRPGGPGRGAGPA